MPSYACIHGICGYIVVDIKEYLHGYNIPLLLGYLGVCVGVLAHHPVQALVAYPRVARAGQVHGQHLQTSITDQKLLITDPDP